MEGLELAYIIISLLIGFALGYFISSKNTDKIKNIASEIHESNTERFTDKFKVLATEISDSNTEKFLRLASHEFESLSKKSDEKLENKKELIDKNLEEMTKKLSAIERESIELNKGLQLSENVTNDLRDKTGKLSQLLAGSKSRGDWGERMAEDIIDFIGLKEGINYQKQTTTKSGKHPDFTFILPKEKIVNMDVKFPLDNYKAYIESEDKTTKDRYKKEFFKDVKNRIKEVTTRDYIDPSSGTLDYVLLFIANESIYTFINEQDTSVIDDALKKQVLLCSPLSLYAILSLIHQSVNNFFIEERTSEVLKQFHHFTQEWEKYKKKTEDMGKSLQAAINHYEALISTRKNTLEKPLEKIRGITGDVEGQSDETLDGQQKL